VSVCHFRFVLGHAVAFVCVCVCACVCVCVTERGKKREPKRVLDRERYGERERYREGREHIEEYLLPMRLCWHTLAPPLSLLLLLMRLCSHVRLILLHISGCA
jgi:hypothetical protein